MTMPPGGVQFQLPRPKKNCSDLMTPASLQSRSSLFAERAERQSLGSP